MRQDARSLAGRVRRLGALTALSDADASLTGRRRFLELELAGSFRVGQLTATRWLHEADRYLTALPRTLALLETGELLVHQATVLLQATGHCPAELAHAVEAELLPGAAGLCPSDLRRLDHPHRAAARVRTRPTGPPPNTATPRPPPNGALSPDPNPTGRAWPVQS